MTGERRGANYAALHTIIIIVLWPMTSSSCGCNFCVHTIILSHLFVGVMMDVAIHGCIQKLVLHIINFGKYRSCPGQVSTPG